MHSTDNTMADWWYSAVYSRSDTDAVKVSAELWRDGTVSRTVKEPVRGGVQEGVGGEQDLGTAWSQSSVREFCLLVVTIMDRIVSIHFDI